MKRTEALAKLNHYNQTLPMDLPSEDRMDLILKFIEQEKIMLPPPEYQSKEGTAYGCEWEAESEEDEHDISAI